MSTPLDIEVALQARVYIALAAAVDAEVFKGGPGSGNFGHSGRPGEVGGSGPAGGVSGRQPGRKPGDKKDRILSRTQLADLVAKEAEINNIPADKVIVHSGEAPAITIAGNEFRPAGVYDPATNTVLVWSGAKMTKDDASWVLAHESMHYKIARVHKAVAVERQAMNAAAKPPLTPDGRLRPEEYHRYPVTASLHESAPKMTPETMQKLNREGRITSYSAMWWDRWESTQNSSNGAVSFKNAFDETLSEMSGHGRNFGILPSSKMWRDTYRAYQNAYIASTGATYRYHSQLGSVKEMSRHGDRTLAYLDADRNPCNARDAVFVVSIGDDGSWTVYTRSVEVETEGKSIGMKGGEGSGNFGHAGRPGMVGGSGPANSRHAEHIAGHGALSADRYSLHVRQGAASGKQAALLEERADTLTSEADKARKAGYPVVARQKERRSSHAKETGNAFRNAERLHGYASTFISRVREGLRDREASASGDAANFFRDQAKRAGDISKLARQATDVAMSMWEQFVEMGR